MLGAEGKEGEVEVCGKLRRESTLLYPGSWLGCCTKRSDPDQIAESAYHSQVSTSARKKAGITRTSGPARRRELGPMGPMGTRECIWVRCAAGAYTRDALRA